MLYVSPMIVGREPLWNLNLAPSLQSWNWIVNPGVAVGVETSNDEIYKFIDEGLDFVQFMGIYQIGFQGNPIDRPAARHIMEAVMAKTENQFSITRSASKIGGAAKKQNSIILPPYGWRLVDTTLYETEHIWQELRSTIIGPR